MTLVSLIFFILEAAWRRRYLVVMPILVMPPLAFVAGGFAPKAYEASTTILVQETAKLNPFLNDLAVGPNLKERMPALISLAHSSHILENVLRDTGAVTDATPENERSRMVAALSASVSVDLMGNDLVAFKIRAGHAEGLAKTLKSLSVRFIERLLAPERSSISDSQTFLKQELAERSKRLSAAQNALSAFKKDNGDRLPTLESGNVTRLSQLEQKLADNRMALEAASAELGDVRSRLIGTNPIIGRIEDDIMQWRRTLGELRSRYTDNHSLVQGALRTLSRLEDERKALVQTAAAVDEADLEKLWNIAAGSVTAKDDKSPDFLVSQMARLQETNSAHVRLATETRALEEEVASIHRIIAETGPVEQELKRLEEGIKFAQDSFDAVAKRFDNAEITGALGEFEAPERIKVIDQAVDPTAPVTPGRILFAIAGFAGGIFLGAGLAASAEMMDTRLRRAAHFEAFAGVPVVARFQPQEAASATIPFQPSRRRYKVDGLTSRAAAARGTDPSKVAIAASIVARMTSSSGRMASALSAFRDWAKTKRSASMPVWLPSLSRVRWPRRS